jgi:hypothetical protein
VIQINKNWASESGHWYTKDGEPAYTYTNAKGEVKNTTLREARKLDLVPSVTTITKILASPGLQVWAQQQVLLSALTLTRNDAESDEFFMERVMLDSREQAKNAAETGEKGHGAIESYLLGKPYDPEWQSTVEACKAAIDEAFPGYEWIPEKSFASEIGFGGRVDLHGTKDGKRAVVDFKSKDGVLNDVKCYDEHFMQAAAYSRGLFGGPAESANLFFSRNHRGTVKLVKHSEEEHQRGWEMFECCLKLWQIKNKF